MIRHREIETKQGDPRRLLNPRGAVPSGLLARGGDWQPIGDRLRSPASLPATIDVTQRLNSRETIAKTIVFISTFPREIGIVETARIGVQGGIGAGPATFSGQKPLADRGWQIRLIDRPGFGQSPSPGPDDMNADARLIADRLGENGMLASCFEVTRRRRPL